MKKRNKFFKHINQIMPRHLSTGMGRRLFVLILSFGAFIIIGLTVVVTVISSRILYKETKTQLHNQTNQVLNAYEQHMQTLENIVLTAEQQTSIQALIKGTYSGYQAYVVSRDSYKYIRQINEFYPFIDMYLFAIEDEYVMGSKEGNVSSDFILSNSPNSSWYDEAKNSLSNMHFEPFFKPPVTGDADCFSIILTVRSIPKWDIKGFIAASLDKSILDQLLKNTSLKQAGFMLVLDDKGNVVYSSDSDLYEKEKENLPSSTYYSEQPLSFDDDTLPNHYLVSLSSSYGSLRFVAFAEKTFMRKNLLQLQIGIFVIVGIGLLLLLIGSSILAQQTTRPITQLIDFLHKVEETEFTEKLEINAKDEVGELVYSFNNMIDSVRENQILRRNAQFDALQKQIDPHFLFNTLESIKGLAIQNETERLCKTIDSLADMFRYNTNRSNKLFTSIAEEYKHINDYLYIQRIRFMDRLNVVIDVDEEIMHFQTLRFILQPVVENSLQHGMENTEKEYELNIYGRKTENGDILFEIIDNGPGIPPDKLKMLNCCFTEGYKQCQNHNSGIGLTNISERMHLVYPPEYGIKIYSEEGIFTKVTILQPLYESEEWQNV